MTSYEKDYSSLEGKEREKAALNDIREYLGDKRFSEISLEVTTLVEHTQVPVNPILFGLAGIEGYPAVVWSRTTAKLAGLTDAEIDLYMTEIMRKNEESLVLVIEEKEEEEKEEPSS